MKGYHCPGDKRSGISHRNLATLKGEPAVYRQVFSFISFP